MGSSVKVAFLGCGNIAKHHLAAFQQSKWPSIISALIDTQVSKADEFAQKLSPKPKIFSSLEDALRWNEFDAVDIMLPHDLHEETTLRCLRAGKHVLLEKPLAHTLESAQRILSDAQKIQKQEPNRVFMVAENSAYWAEVIKAGDLIAEGSIGEVHSANANYWETALGSPFASFMEDWRYDTEKVGGGIVIDGCSHWIRPLRMWMGEIDEVVGHTTREAIPSMKGESFVRALIRFKSGKFGQLSGTLTSSALSKQPFFQIFGTKGEIIIHGSFDGGMTVYNNEYPSGLVMESQGGFMGSYAPEVDDFMSAITNKTPLKASAEQALGEMQTALAIYKSIQTKKWEKVFS